jgi:uncharacterized membrane protein (DUF2068 family)
MKRPVGITVIRCFFFLAGIYLCSISAVILIVPSAIPTLRTAPLVRGLRLVSPYMTLASGVGWVLIAWGLFQLHEWARWVAQIVLAIGIAWALPMLLFQAHFGWRMLAAILEIALRATVVFYLFLPAVLDVFTRQRRDQKALILPRPER